MIHSFMLLVRLFDSQREKASYAGIGRMKGTVCKYTKCLLSKVREGCQTGFRFRARGFPLKNEPKLRHCRFFLLLFYHLFLHERKAYKTNIIER